MTSFTKSMLTVSFVLSGTILVLGLSPANAETTRVITPVDENGNPTGPSRTIVIPDDPTGSATVEPVDVNGNSVGSPIQIPDSNVEPPPSTSDPDLQPEGSGTPEPDSGSATPSEPDSGSESGGDEPGANS